MEQQNQSQQLRQRKFFMIFPLIALPFITLLFWALGGGSPNNAMAAIQSKKGFNTELPDANFEMRKPLNKMSYYDKAALDSAKLQELKKNDPYYSRETADAAGSIEKDGYPLSDKDWQSTYSYEGNGYSTSVDNNPNEKKVYQKLARLNKALREAKAIQDTPALEKASLEKPASVSNEDIDKLKRIMASVDRGDVEDPDMKQINTMLEKIMDIQHPLRVEDRLKQRSKQRRGQVFAVSAYRKSDPISLLTQKAGSSSFHDNALKDPNNGFYSLENASYEITQNTIRAEIYETQTVVSGSIIKFRLLNDIYINGAQIPKENFVFGVASLNGERLNITLNSIRYKNSLFPVSLSVYDLDGLSGIYIPGAISRKAAKESADRSIQSVGISSIDPSWQTQTAEAGIEAAQNLLSKKVKLVKVTVKAGYQVLLYDEKRQ